VLHEGFFNNLEELLENKNNDFFTINDIWCHFIITKQKLHSFNWFDERFLGEGLEDWDISRHKQKPPQWRTNLATSLDNTDAAEMIKRYESQGMKPEGKYSKFNQSFYREKNLENIHKEAIQYPYFEFEQKNKYNL